MMQEFNVDWKAECGQFNLEHATRTKNIVEEETKTNKCHCSPSPVQVQDVRSQAVARIANRTASQHLWGSRDVISHVTIW